MKKAKVLLAILLIALCVFSVVNFSYAAWDDVNQFDNKGTTASGKVVNIVGAIVDIMRIVGTGVALIMIIAIAIKYMASAPGDRADIKKHAIPFVVGAVVLFASTNILGVIKDFAKGL